MSLLRRRMVVAMRVRHFSERTEESYLHAIEQLYAFYRRMPDRLSRDEVVVFLEHCVSVRKLQHMHVRQERLRQIRSPLDTLLTS